MLSIKFGSRPRGDSDFLSDKDILLLASGWDQINIAMEEKAAEGFSVSAFLYDKAVFLTKNGNLFFKHICDEGILVSGSSEYFQWLISQWQASNNYYNEIYENLDLLEVICFTPQSNEGVIVAVDILISSVRNILIRRLANQGEYVFSWRKIFITACRRGMIKKEDVLLFIKARQLKNQYRLGKIPQVSLNYFESLLIAATRACGSALRQQFTYRAKLRSLPEQFVDGTYKQLRAIELMCAEYSFHQSTDTLLALVRQPAYFCANGPNMQMKRKAEVIKPLSTRRCVGPSTRKTSQ